ncbi:carbonic anhydrase [Massariosphaeria phaeospora]|uniref:Carbonic anhydrase n=1 Tax=Massariosphaeria phaeospora TaxID=100035 RepID=A0A7C8I4L3_9PLEO|nr:carbonic anhydrase [Massariosphaeria phaeospora]
MYFQSLLALAVVLPAALACPQHNTNKKGKRAAAPSGNTTTDWAYEASYNWGQINEEYELCQTGTQQAPIALFEKNGLSLNHNPTFNYPSSVKGALSNWGYGPAFTVATDGDWTKHPSFSYDNVTLYLAGWHIHAPADHSVNGDRSKAEMHFVHADSAGNPAAVLAFRLDPGTSDNDFLSQLPPMVGHRETQRTEDIAINMIHALKSVHNFNEFWTYRGSLTSPPCTEGIRFFVARQVMYTGVKQMQDILRASTYSARAEQEVWQHRINE